MPGKGTREWNEMKRWNPPLGSFIGLTAFIEREMKGKGILYHNELIINRKYQIKKCKLMNQSREI